MLHHRGNAEVSFRRLGVDGRGLGPGPSDYTWGSKCQRGPALDEFFALFFLLLLTVWMTEIP